ncbi:MAG: 30S ribosomal protein S4, partial [Nitrosopumilus sp.]
YTVTVNEEDSVHFAPESKIPEMLEKTKKEEPVVEATEEETEGEVPKEATEEKTVETPAEASKDETSSTE